MTANLPIRATDSHQAIKHGDFTYGVLAPIETQALTALIEDIHRTLGIIDWLEHYISTLTTTEAFNLAPHVTTSFQQAYEQQKGSTANPHATPANKKPSALAIQLDIKRQQRASQRAPAKPGLHPAIVALQTERRHLHNITTSAITLGIKLDNIDYTRKQADLMVTAMFRFAQAAQLDTNDPRITELITSAMNDTIEQEEQTVEATEPPA